MGNSQKYDKINHKYTVLLSRPLSEEGNKTKDEETLMYEKIIMKENIDYIQMHPRELFNKTKPVVAAANPEKELSKEITTGISAPPIGITPK